MATLRITTPDGRERVIPLSRRPLRLGRSEVCDVVLSDDVEVSREHAEIWVDEEGRVVVADLGSKNGTRVDDGDPFRRASRIAYYSVRIGDHAGSLEGVSLRPGPDARSRVQFAPDFPTHGGDTKFFPSSKRLDLNQQRLALLISLTERIGGAFDRKQLLEQALDACCEALQFDRGLIALRTPRGETEHPVTRNVARDETGAFRISSTLINRALVHGERAIVNNPAKDLDGRLTESLVRFPISSALSVPILHRDEILGVIYGDRITQGAPYQPADVDFLAAIAQQVGVGLANLRLFQEYARSQRMFAELDRARAIQRQLLPAEPFELGRVRIEGHNVASSTVSGDYFDYFPIGSDKLGFIIADVTGHGLAAALIMANLQAALHVALRAQTALCDLAAGLNSLLYRNTSPLVFVTGILGMIDVYDGTVEFVSAGHPGPIVINGRTVRVLETENSLPFGVEPDESFHVQRLPAGDSNAVLFFTDGIPDAANPTGARLGMDPLLRALRRCPESDPPQLIAAALDSVQHHLGGAPVNDDMTLLAVRLNPS